MLVPVPYFTTLPMLCVQCFALYAANIDKIFEIISQSR